MKRNGSVAIVLIIGIASGSCGSEIIRKNQIVQVGTTPPGAKVWVKDDTGTRVVGSSPTELRFEYNVHRTKDFNAHWWWSLLPTTGVMVGNFGTLLSVDHLSDSAATRLFFTGIAFAGVAAIQLIALTVMTLRSGRQTVDLQNLDLGIKDQFKIKSSTPSISIGATLEGYADQSAAVSIPSSTTEANFLLKPLSLPAVQAKSSSPAAAKTAAEAEGRKIVAVFDIQDSNGIVDNAALIQITNYLGTALTKTGKFSTIPRDQLRARLLDEKQGSYKSCFDESCQLELGKALSAEKSLATQIIRVGKKCAVTANLYDLKRETAEKGALVNTGCAAEEILDAMNQIAAQMAGPQ